MDRLSLLENIRTRLDESPAVALLGARQVGKTTLAVQLASEWKGRSVVFDLERPAVRAALEISPEQTLSGLSGLVVIDEIQRLPALLETLRPLCDAPDRQSVFLLLGSASWDVVKGISESLAGRVQFVDVPGFSISETGASTQEALWLRGGFPKAFLAKDTAAWERWVGSFFQTFIERDIPGLGSRVAPEAIGRFWRMLSHYHGQVWNAAELARSMDTSAKSATHYRDLLAGTFMIRVLPPWYENIGKRLVKSPKIYLRDSGILHYLLGVSDMHQLRTHARYGSSWEGFALEQTLIAQGGRDAYFYATQSGAELDLLLFRRGKKIGFEFKCSDAPRLTKSMQTIFSDLRLEHLYAVYPGTLRYALADGITALPLCEIPALPLASET
ncbi:MAG: ATP-binding protein [Verrucomicrobiota bacterium]|jgi:predicted AAA+ superfamily ATPase|nr:ATP-binding protein [Verrucomicrobiota bacterium]